jgi:REP element-mobilizing transposase RayT
MAIFLDADDYRKFVYLLGDTVERFALDCWNYCVMPNHYHLTLQPTLPNLSRAIQDLNGRYGMWWNKRHDRVGHTFQGRFKDQIVDKAEYLLSLSRYVAMNPVRASLVSRPEDWLWSSYRSTVGACQAPSFLATWRTLTLFGEGPASELQARFIHFVTACEEDPAALDRFRSKERVIGSSVFKRQIEARRPPQSAASHLPDSISPETPLPER